MMHHSTIVCVLLGFSYPLSVANSTCTDYCLHNSTCLIDNKGELSCKCADGYFGRICEFNQNTKLCKPNPCANGGLCGQQADEATFTCRCTPGYLGTRCIFEYDDCENNLCVHGGCVDALNSYSCQCDQGWMGQHCNLVNTTATEPPSAKRKSGWVAPFVVLLCIVLMLSVFCVVKKSKWCRRRSVVGSSVYLIDDDTDPSARGHNIPLSQVGTSYYQNLR